MQAVSKALKTRNLPELRRHPLGVKNKWKRLFCGKIRDLDLAKK